jgi:hypothetical protein
MNLRLGLLAATAVALATGHAAAAPTYGSASESTYRDCSTTTAGAACDGALEPQQRVVTFTTTGGALSTANTDLTLSGQTVPAPGGGPGVVVLPSDGSYARGSVDFAAGLDLPIIHGSTLAAGQERMNTNSLGYQSYDNTGPAEAFSLSGTLNIDDSSSDGGDGTLANGAIYTAYVAIWDPSVLGGYVTAQDIFDNTFLASCGTAGVLAVGQMSGPLSGGAASYSFTTQSCSGGGDITLAAGQEILAVVGLQLPVNRGGFADASHTFTTSLGSDLSADTVAALTQNLASGESLVPEPASWAVMIAGFFGLGGLVRRRNASLAV